MHPYSSIDATAVWKKLRFILSVRSDFHIIDSLLIAVHAFVNLVSIARKLDNQTIPIKKNNNPADDNQSIKSKAFKKKT